MGKGLHVAILGRTEWGLKTDADLIELALREANAAKAPRIDSIEYRDSIMFYGNPKSPPKPVDIQIHLEAPARAALGWAKVNVLLVNPEWWPKESWNWTFAKEGFDMFLFRSAYARSLFPEIDDKRARILPWRAGTPVHAALSALEKTPQTRNFLYLIGASENKLASARTIVQAWKPSWPALTVVGTDDVVSKLRDEPAKENVTIRSSYGSEAERLAAQRAHAYHIVASAAEGFGYTFSEAAAFGALPLWCGLPVYEELYGSILGDVGKIPICTVAAKGAYRDPRRAFDAKDVDAAVRSLLELAHEEEVRMRGALRHAASTRSKEFRHGWRGVLKTLDRRVAGLSPVVLPPRGLTVSELPEVAVITVTRNRPKWFANMARNILHADYPPDKLSWIVVDDADPVTESRLDAKVSEFSERHPRIRVAYVPLDAQHTIGEKRNIACRMAPSSASVFVCMDDDDHYPAASILNRVTWMTGSKKDCAYCSTLFMYHCGKYISAVNVPPLDLSPSERVSEATLCFTRKFWEACPFPPVGMAEGEGFIAGREHQTIEIPPNGVIVSFLHGRNASSRRLPESNEPNGCHYGFDDDYFTYISGLA